MFNTPLEAQERRQIYSTSIKNILPCITEQFVIAIGQLGYFKLSNPSHLPRTTLPFLVQKPRLASEVHA